MNQFATVAETVDKANPDIRILQEWQQFGVTAGIAGTLGGSDYRAPTEGDPRDPWAALQATLGASRLIMSRQPHGNRIAVHQDTRLDARVLDGFDGHVTTQPGVFVAVTVADCVPIYLAAPRGTAVGILHGGWRGIAKGIVESGISELASCAQCLPREVLMHCGISICGDCYDVGPEVWEALGEDRPSVATPIDLSVTAARRAARVGVESISISPACTAHDRNRLQSFRRDGAASGRMAAFIGKTPP
jgi:hypothetical protein